MDGRNIMSFGPSKSFFKFSMDKGIPNKPPPPRKLTESRNPTSNKV